LVENPGTSDTSQASPETTDASNLVRHSQPTELEKLKSLNSDKARRIRVRPVLAYPAVTVALVVSVALALTPFGTSQVMALGAVTIPMETTAPTATSTSSPSTTTQTPAETASPSATSTSTSAVTPSPSPIPSESVAAAPGDHHVLARIEGPLLQANYLPVDEPVLDASRFQTFRVRFRLHNAGTAAITTTPRLEFRPEGVGSYAVVPEKPLLGVPFHVDREWVPSLGLGGGTMQSELGEDIAVASLRIGDEAGLAVTGHRAMGANPDQPVTLPSDSYTEQEFTVTLSIDAKYLTGYELRITDAGTPLTGTDVAVIHLGAPPAVQLSPGQRQGVDVVDPAPASSSAGAAYPLLSAQSIAASTTSVSAVPAVGRPSAVDYPLIANTLAAATVPASDIHGPYTMTTDKCATCHRGHAAQAPNLLVKGSQSALCLTCHDGTQATANVSAEYTDPSVPDNLPGNREYYSHDVEAASTHTRSELDEFGGQTNRHSSCADCHNSHKAKGTDSTQTLTGWTASGRLAGVSGVSVENGAAGSAPTYTFLDGLPTTLPDPVTLVEDYPVSREYQLCFKCHSGFTTLPANNPLKPSRDALDKGVEFNPANASFHPVEAAGKNGTDAMTASLGGTSPYKLWDLSINSTVRCLNCHAGGATDPAATPPLPLPGTSLAPHASSNRGILLENYRDRVLKPGVDVIVGGVVVDSAAYNAKDFALCYVCHAEAPFAPYSESSNATNFSFHSKHLAGMTGKGDGGKDIDAAGDGQSNAICAECHFRIHSTTNKVGEQGGPRLVKFSPNVEPLVAGGTPSWTLGATSGGSCTLTCHTKEHNGLEYGP